MLLLSVMPLLAVPALAEDVPDETVVVRAPEESSSAHTSGAVTHLRIDERLPASADIGQVLDAVPGARVVALGGLGDLATVSIRGSTLRQVQIYIDGVPLNPDGAVTVNLSELPVHAFERVEVWRSGAPPHFAAAPIGGVVNLVTADTMPTSGMLSYGSHGYTRLHATGGASTEAAGRPLDVAVTAEAMHTRSDYLAFSDNATVYDLTDDTLSPRDNNDKSQLAANARIRLGDDDLSFTVLDAFLARDEGVPGPVNTPSPSARLETLRNLAVAQVDGAAGATRATGRVWLLQREEIFDDTAGELLGALWTGAWYTTFGALGHASVAPTPAVVPALTLAARTDSYVAADFGTDRVSTPRRRYALTGSASAELFALDDRLTLAPVLQGQWIDNRSLSDVPFDDTQVAPDRIATDGALAPRLGLAVRPWTPLTLKANVARTFRPPDLTELFGVHGTMVGNSELVPERGLNWDVGGRLEADTPQVAAALDVTHFWTRTEDLIVLVQNAQQVSVPENLGLTWVQGLEAGLELAAFDALDSSTSLTWSLSRNLTPDPSVANNQLPRVPVIELWQATSVHVEDRIRVGHTFSHTAGNYWDATNWYLAAPRSLHGAFVRVQPWQSAPSAELSVLNLTNRIAEVVVRDPLNPDDGAYRLDPITDFVGYPLAGRTFVFTLRWSA